MVQEGIVQVNLGKKLDVMPQKNVSKKSDKDCLRTYFIHIYMYIKCMAMCMYICSEVLLIMSYTYTLSYSRPCMQCYIPLLYISLYYTADLQPALYRKSIYRKSIIVMTIIAM